MDNTSDCRLLCAWCGVILREGAEPASHGICVPCRANFFPTTVKKEVVR